MKEKKHIDRFFKEHFENFDASPSPQVWKQIQAQLKKEDKDRKVIPLWIKLGGVAAFLALLLTVGISVFNSSNKNTPAITEENSTPNIQNKEANDLSKENNIDNDVIALDDENATKNDREDISNRIEVKNDAFVKKSESLNTDITFENDVMKTTDKTINNKNKLKKEDALVNPPGINEVVAITPIVIDSEKGKPSEKTNETLIKKDVTISEATKAEVANTEEKNKENSEVVKPDEANKRSLIDVINEQNKEEAIVTVKNKPENQWGVTPNFAPVYYSSLSDGSSLDPTFSDNSQSGDVNFSYGIRVSYYINDRLSLRSGINNVNLSYVTGGIELGTGPVSAALKSVDYGSSKEIVITAVDKGTFAGQNSNGMFGEITPKSTSGEAEIIQKLSYYEIPLEIEYALIDTKFGFSLISGLSTLFLGDNEVSVKAGDFEDVLGPANNLSSVSITANIGVGLNYKFSKKLMFNIEPMFKYQLNPYTDSSVNFKPYYIGIYSGLSFKF